MKTFIKNNPLVFLMILLSISLIVMNMISDWQSGHTEVEKIRRNNYENESRRVTAVMETEIGGEISRRNVELTVEPMELTEEEKTRRLDAFEEILKTLIRGENHSLKEVSVDLNLITKDPSTGITLLWSSSNPELIDEKGRVYPSGDSGKEVDLSAVMELDGMTREWSVKVVHHCVPDAENFQRSLESELPEVNRLINEDSSRRYAALPDKLQSGIPVRWRNPADHRYYFAGFLALLTAVFLYRKKKSDRKRVMEERRQDISRDFPYFLDKLVMLLSAGVILTEAVYRIWGDYERFQRKTRRKVFYEELGESVRSMRNSNAAFSSELIRMSERLGVREFARLAVVLRDSLGSGNDLVSKLENESILMWRERKAAVQTLGRVADTKLVFPLMIILTVLIIIVMTPAILQL